MFPGRSSFFTPIKGYQLGIARQGINWSSFLNNAGKTLNVINQAIPVFYQVKPVFNNLKTMFKVAHEFKKTDETTNFEQKKEEVPSNKTLRNPVFFK